MSESESADDPTAEIRADIEHTRAELAGTVDALSDKLNVKARASDKVAEAKAKVAGATEQVRPYGTQILVGTLAAAAVLVIVRKWRG